MATPTFSKFYNNIAGTEDTAKEITYSNLIGNSNASSITDGFLVTSINTSAGTLYYWNGASWVDATGLTNLVISKTGQSVGETVSGTPDAIVTTKVKFEPLLNSYGLVDAFSVKAVDNTDTVYNTADLTAASTTAVSVKINLTAVNDAPTLDVSKTHTFTAITEDVSSSSNYGNTVASFVADGSIADKDVSGTPSESIYVTSVDNSNGTWQYKVATGEWTAFDFSGANADKGLLLNSTDSIRFLPKENFNGTSEITFGAWDRTSGTAGNYVTVSGTAFSTATDTASINITPVNDAPVITGTSETPISADDSTVQTLFSNVTISDIDSDVTVTITPSNNTHGTWSNLNGFENENGTLTFTGTALQVTNAIRLINFTPTADKSYETTFTILVNDGVNTVTNTQTVLKVTDANNAPTLEAITSGSISEVALSSTTTDVNLTGSFVGSDSDGLSLVYGITEAEVIEGMAIKVGTFGTLTLNTSTGEYKYTKNESAIEALDFNDTNSDVFEITVKDEQNATATRTFIVNVSGANDSPTVSEAIIAGANEGSGDATVDLLANASDIDNGETETLSVSNVTYSVNGSEASATLPTGVTLTGTTLTVDTNNAAFNTLAVGQELTLVVNYNVVDTQGAIVAQTATLTLTGTNDVPTVSAAIIAGANEGSGDATVNLLTNVSDIDNGETATLSVANVTYSVNGSAASSDLPTGVTLTGSTLTVDTNNAAFNALVAGEKLTLVVKYDVVDAQGDTVAQIATLTLTGTNDAPIVTKSEITLNDGLERLGQVTLTTSMLTVNDIDSDSSPSTTTVTLVEVPNGFIYLNGTKLNGDGKTGSFTMQDVINGNVKYESGTEGSAESFTFTVKDAYNATTSTQTLTASLILPNMAPTIAGLTSPTTTTEDANAILIAPAATIGNEEYKGSNGFAGGYLEVAVSSNADMGDILAVSTNGTGITVDGLNVSYNGTLIGTIDSTLNGTYNASTNPNSTLKINFVSTFDSSTGKIADASKVAVQTLLKAISYSSVETGVLVDESKVISFSLNDGNVLGTDFSGQTKIAKTSELGTVTVTVHPVNDAPVLTVNTITLDEGETVVLSAANFAATDVDVPADTLTFTVSNVKGGTFQLVSDDSVVTSFTAEQIANGEIKFVDNGDEVAPSFDTVVSDGTNSTEAAAATVNYTPVNDNTPVLTVNTITLNEGESVVLSAANFAATDVDVPADTLTFTVSNVTGGTFQLVSDNSVVTSFTAEQIANGEIKFVDNGDEVAPSFSTVVSDGTNSTEAAAATVNYTPVNDAPTLTLENSSVTTINGGTVTFSSENSNLISVSDVDTDEELTVNLTVFNGTIDLTDGSGVSFGTGSQDASQSNISMTGNVAQINAALAGMVLTATGSLDANLMISVADGRENGVTSDFGMIDVVVGASDVPNEVNLSTSDLDITNYDISMPVFVSGVSASQTDVLVTTSTVISYDAYSLTLGDFIGDLDGTAVQFTDGSLLKTASSSSTLVGGVHDDQLIGSDVADILRGYAGNDKLLGGAGNDVIYGGKGADIINGGLGNDLLYAGDSAADDLSADIFQYLADTNEGNDFIVGFKDGSDKIELLTGTFEDDVTVSASGNNTVLTLTGGTTVTLVNVIHTNITADDFTVI
ncbi:Ig-like domain-containing protein [Aliarcobacter cryaerophilus]|uniref:beta strand repeat-containing protein n=1 Tax=Aliarcobacter cryaerophilus TaxID=28198 RepID=UPI003DA5671A